MLHGLSLAGTERIVYDLATALSDRVTTAVACLDREGPLGEELRKRSIEVHCTNRRPGLDFRQVSRLSGIIRSFRPDVIHCHQYTPFFYGVPAATWARRGRVIFTEHGRHHPDRVGRLRRMVNPLLIARTDRVTAVCEFTRDRLVEKEGIGRERIEVIYNGVDVSRFDGPPDRPAVRRSLGVDDESCVVVQVGTFRPVKDQATALRAFDRVREQYPRAVLLFVGDGPDRAECEALARSLDLNGVVRFLGSRGDIPAVLAAADIFLLTSVSEAHSLSVLEAMAARLPVIATDVGGNHETVVNGQTGFLVPPRRPAELAETLIRMLRDPALRGRMGQAGRQRVVENFSQPLMHQKYLDLYVALSERGAGS